MKLTPSQQAAISHRGASLLVSASAGSGKTEVLTQGCVSLIADPRGPCAIEQLLVVTFTRAAAAELRLRIARALRERAVQTREAALRDHLHRQSLLVDAADIGTIDAWCGRIVRAHSAEAGIDAEFTTLAEEDARLLRRQVLDELFEWVYSADDELPRAARDWLGRHARPDDGFLRDHVRKLNEFREHLVEVDLWRVGQQQLCHLDDDALRADAQQLLSATLAEECARQHGQLASLSAGSCGAVLADSLTRYQDALGDWARRLRARPVDLTRIVAELESFDLGKPRGLAGADAALLDEIKTRWLERQLQQRWFSADVQNMLATAPAAAGFLRTLLDLEQGYHDRLTAAKRVRAAYEFGDVLRFTLDLLGTPNADGPRRPTPIAQRLRQRYAHVLVDEYQDTSPVQVEILRLVSRDEAGHTNRFLVGDVKQSIYGFRQAEPGLFTDLADALARGSVEGKLQHLSDNFRSHPDLLAGLNRLFARLFHRALGGTDFAPAERLCAAREEIASPTLDSHPRIELHVFEPPAEEPAPRDDDEESIPLERLEREALVAAEMIRRMLDDKVCTPERDADGRLGLRPLGLSDIVILLRSAKYNAATVAGVLRAAGIPCLTSGRDALFDVPEVTDVRNVLMLLTNRRQDLPLAAYLRGPLVGLTAAELLRIRHARSDGDFWDAVARFCLWSDENTGRTTEMASTAEGDDEALVAKVRTALHQLDRWRVAAREAELPDLLRRIYEDTALPLFAAGLPGGEHRVALLRAVVNFATEFARTGQHGVAEFVAYVDDLAAADVEPGLPVPAGQDAVRIMTIHAAKGLEFPVVFLLNAGSPFNLARGRDALQCDAEHGVGLRFFDYPARTDVRSARQHVISQSAVQRDIAEELRLLYVATTRARERLLIFGHAAAGAWEAARERYAGGRELPLPTRQGARNMMEWVLMAATATEAAESPSRRLAVTVHATSGIRPAPRFDAEPPRIPESPAWGPDDEAWLGRAHTLLSTRVDTSCARWPAVLSVSALKELARRQRDEDVPHSMDAGAGTLRWPGFAAPPEPEPRQLGLACHRFLELADPRQLQHEAAIRAQLDSLVAAGHLSAVQAALVPVADIVWFGGTPLAQQLAAHVDTLRREFPFVYALPIPGTGERVIVRGVVDCVLEGPAGFVILDYKTDLVADEAGVQQRMATYAVQLQLYAEAVGHLLARSVNEALLIFLSARRIVAVPTDAPAALPAFTILP